LFGDAVEALKGHLFRLFNYMGRIYRARRLSEQGGFLPKANVSRLICTTESDPLKSTHLSGSDQPCIVLAF